MPVICKLCGQSFDKQITNSHLKRHNTTTTEYKAIYGEHSLSCPEYRASKRDSLLGQNNPNYGNHWSDDQRQKMSDKNKGSSPWNKGKKIPTTQSMKDGINAREEKYRAGTLQRPHVKHSDTTKSILSTKQRNYAANNPDDMKTRAKKSIDTKRKNNYDFGANMRGKSHSDATKLLISEKSKMTGIKKTQDANNYILTVLPNVNLSYVGRDGKYIIAQCNTCKSTITHTSQVYSPAKLKENYCYTCNPIPRNTSKGESELYEFIKSMYPDAIQAHREHYHGLELDVYIPSINIGFEYNGLYWHSEEVLKAANQHKHKDFLKFKTMRDNGIRVVTIFEDEWRDKNDITKSRIASILGKSSNKIYARKCEIAVLDSKTSNAFLSEHHILGKDRSIVKLGLVHDSELVAVMTFSQSNISRKVHSWELNRYCSLTGYNIVGGASKLLSHFVKTSHPESIISYADNRWSTGELYKKLGFEFVSPGVPNYWYVKNGVRTHRYTLRKTADDDQNLTEYENRLLQGYIRVWDCGSSKWILKNPT